MDANSLLAVFAMLLALAIPVVAIVGLLRISLHRLAGRRSGHDRLLGTVSRAGVHYAHLQADTPGRR